MRLDYVCDIHLIRLGQPAFVQPYGSEEGTAFIQADGTVHGERLRGTVRAANYPHRRSDGTMMPDVRGAIQTEDGAMILFVMQGRTTWVETAQGRKGRQLTHVLFEAQDASYQWLNGTLCVAEGEVEADASQMHARVYACVSDLL